MGYTHYFTQLEDFTEEEWYSFQGEVKKIVAEFDGRLETVLDAREVRIDDGAWETFIINRWMPSNTREHDFIPAGFGFCKTGRAHYDLVVTASLMALHSIVPTKFRIASDGSWNEDWQEGRVFYTMATGKTPTCPMQVEADA